MDISFLTNYAVPIVVGICICVGYIIKEVIPSDKINRFIPVIMGVLGVVINVWLNLTLTPEILLGGLVSGLAATGLHEAVKNIFFKNSNKEEL